MGQSFEAFDRNAYVCEHGGLVPTPEFIATLSDEELVQMGLGKFLKKVAKKLVQAVSGDSDAGDEKEKEDPAEAGCGMGGFCEKEHPRGPDGRFTEKDKVDESKLGAQTGGVVPEAPVKKITGRMGEDPFVTRYKGRDVLIESTDGSDLKISYVDLKTMKTSETVDIPAVKGEKNVWAPELHEIGGKWNIFYTSTGQSDANEDHRMYAIQGGKSPFDPFTKKVQLGASSPSEDVWGIDMTPFKVGNKNYVSWSGWEGKNDGFPQNLYVAELKVGRNGALSTGPRTKISSPTGWEGEIMEGPQVVRDPKGRTVLTYSGNKSWSTDYSLGALKLSGDPLKASSWKKKPEPIAKNVGHGSWVDGKHVYHAKTTNELTWDDRELRSSDYRWVNGYPVLDLEG